MVLCLKGGPGGLSRRRENPVLCRNMSRLESERAAIICKELSILEQTARIGAGLDRPLSSVLVLGFGFTSWGFGFVPFS
jgi:hypothetical protein